jgi:hypothetical protein
VSVSFWGVSRCVPSLRPGDSLPLGFNLGQGKVPSVPSCPFYEEVFEAMARRGKDARRWSVSMSFVRWAAPCWHPRRAAMVWRLRGPWLWWPWRRVATSGKWLIQEQVSGEVGLSRCNDGPRCPPGLISCRPHASSATCQQTAADRRRHR